MFTFTSNATKISALALSVFAALCSMDSVTAGFQLQSHSPVMATLPSITVVGHRTQSTENIAQTGANESVNPTI